MKVIVCTPDPDLTNFLRMAAEQVGFDSDVADIEQDMCSALFREPLCIGVVYADRASAAHLAREFRAAEVNCPLLIYSNAPRVNEIVAALYAGADDIQPLPSGLTAFEFRGRFVRSPWAEEYQQRLLALARRDRNMDVATVELPNEAKFHPARGAIEHPGGIVSLSRSEASLLELLMLRPGVVTKEMCMTHLYGGRDEAQIKIVDVFVCKIRRKLLSATAGIDVIETVWGEGYRFVAAGYLPTMTDARKRVPA